MTMHPDTGIATHQPAPAPEAEPAQGGMVSMIERVVMDPGLSMDRIEKMLELQERIEAREARKAFDRAMAAAKSEIKPIIKDAKVDFTSSKGRTNYQHETLGGIARQVDPILSRCGLSYRFRTRQDGGKIIVTCVIAHVDGYFEENALEGAADDTGGKNRHQQVASAVTYLQRYSLKAALGLAVAADDDGQAADRNEAKSLTEDQFRQVRDLIEQTGTDEARFLGFFKVDAIHDVPAGRFYEAMAMLNRKRAEAAERDRQGREGGEE